MAIFVFAHCYNSTISPQSHTMACTGRDRYNISPVRNIALPKLVFSGSYDASILSKAQCIVLSSRDLNNIPPRGYIALLFLITSCWNNTPIFSECNRVLIATTDRGICCLFKIVSCSFAQVILKFEDCRAKQAFLASALLFLRPGTSLGNLPLKVL